MPECTPEGCFKNLVGAFSNQWSTAPYGHQPKPRRTKPFRARGNFESFPCKQLQLIPESTLCPEKKHTILENPKSHATDQGEQQKQVHLLDQYPEQKYLTACFSISSTDTEFLDNVKNQKVCLENVAIADLTIVGTVRVANIAFHKTVKVRFTANGWKNFYDIQACYIKGSCDGPTDRFAFGITPPRSFETGDRIELAISFEASGGTYWDNNNKKNYVFECFKKTKHHPNIATLCYYNKI
ncbi:protein phosphatase 1 regulatory subunit 3C-like isoform X2 [Saccoglossus kowalevskii]